jgi:hypothetical protein
MKKFDVTFEIIVTVEAEDEESVDTEWAWELAKTDFKYNQAETYLLNIEEIK